MEDWKCEMSNYKGRVNDHKCNVAIIIVNISQINPQFILRTVFGPALYPSPQGKQNRSQIVRGLAELEAREDEAGKGGVPSLKYQGTCNDDSSPLPSS